MSPSNSFIPGRSIPLGQKSSPFYPPGSQQLLEGLGFGRYLEAPPLSLTVIGDDARQTAAISERLALAGERFLQLAPAILRPRVIAQRAFDVKEIAHQAALEAATLETTGLCLLVLLCKVEPVDLVIGIGENGQALVADLRHEAPKMYPAQVQKFVTQAELEQEAASRHFAGERDAFLLVAFERLYGTKIAKPSSGT